MAGVYHDGAGRHVGAGGAHVDPGQPCGLGHDSQVLSPLLFDLCRCQQGFDSQLSPRLQGCNTEGRFTDCCLHNRLGVGDQVSSSRSRPAIPTTTKTGGLQTLLTQASCCLATRVRIPDLVQPPRLLTERRFTDTAYTTVLLLGDQGSSPRSRPAILTTTQTGGLQTRLFHNDIAALTTRVPSCPNLKAATQHRNEVYRQLTQACKARLLLTV